MTKGSGWVQVDSEFLDHWKLERAATLLDCDPYALAGHIIKLWGWAFKNATEQGALWWATPRMIADRSGWRGEPAAYLDALVKCGEPEHVGFIELGNNCLILHDWVEYSGKYQKRLNEDAGRKRADYEKKRGKSETPGILQGDSGEYPMETPTDTPMETPRSIRRYSVDTPAAQGEEESTPPTNTILDDLGDGGVKSSSETPMETPMEKHLLRSAERVLAYYRKLVNPVTRLRPMEQIMDRLANYSEETLQTAIDRFRADPGHMARVGSKPPSWFFGSDELIEEFLAIKAPGENGTSTKRKSNGGRGHDLANPHRNYLGRFAAAIEMADASEGGGE